MPGTVSRACRAILRPMACRRATLPLATALLSTRTAPRLAMGLEAMRVGELAACLCLACQAACPPLHAAHRQRALHRRRQRGAWGCLRCLARWGEGPWVLRLLWATAWRALPSACHMGPRRPRPRASPAECLYPLRAMEARQGAVRRGRRLRLMAPALAEQRPPPSLASSGPRLRGDYTRATIAPPLRGLSPRFAPRCCGLQCVLPSRVKSCTHDISRLVARCR
mmetsp:Transcript_21228/g.42956  ORF Transcript_21228/g.42956 Transcript_21228/m.42956 type:complete len:224 (+) Transcript_21228:175-846(+)